MNVSCINDGAAEMRKYMVMLIDRPLRPFVVNERFQCQHNALMSVVFWVEAKGSEFRYTQHRIDEARMQPCGKIRVAEAPVRRTLPGTSLARTG